MAKFSEKDIKILWARAAGLCSMPDCRAKLTQNAEAVAAAAALGQMAHIVAEEEDGPRGKSSLLLPERNSYPNLILLCPSCHTKIDKAELVKDYPIEKLHYIKSMHEQWVEESLVGGRDVAKEAADLVYTTLIDSVVNDCMLESWTGWISGFVAVFPNCNMSVFHNLQMFWEKIQTAVWPGTNAELEAALKALEQATSGILRVFEKHADLSNRNANVLVMAPEFRHYKFADNAKTWTQLLDQLAKDATCAANWLADVVRRDINPMFFVTAGRFRIYMESVAPQGNSAVYVPEFTDAEKKRLMTTPLASAQEARAYESKPA